ncbi:MAG: hypothetical protein NC489_37795 [Ruminococcus flavefaciens]|nr:hypothetical protein [Ruminococcus flavefaciens]
MARLKNIRFGVDDDLFKEYTQQVQEVQQVQQVQEDYKEIGSTQGRKGQKLKRINMAFSDMNHDYITKESRRRGITATAFVNQIIDGYRKRS